MDDHLVHGLAYNESRRTSRQRLEGRISEPAVLTRQTLQARKLFSTGSSEICPYRACTPTDLKFLAQVTEPELLVSASY